MGTRLLKKIDLLDGINKASYKNLSVPDMTLVVTMELDSTLEELIDKGKEGLRWQTLQDAAEDYVKPARKAIAESLKLLNDKVATLSGPEAEKLVTTTHVVLQKAAIGQEQGVNAAVEKVWAEAIRRNATLGKYKRKCITKAIVGALAISTSLASMIASGGSNLLGVVTIMKTVAELAILVADVTQSVDDAARELEDVMEDVRKKIDSGKQPNRKAEFASDVSTILGKMMATVKTADQNQVKFEAKIAALEKNADSLVGSLNASLDKMLKIKTTEKAKLERIKDLAAENRKVLKEITAISKELKVYIQYNEAARKEIADWKAKRLSKTKAAIKLGTFLKLAVGLGAAARTFGKIAGLPIP